MDWNTIFQRILQLYDCDIQPSKLKNAITILCYLHKAMLIRVCIPTIHQNSMKFRVNIAQQILQLIKNICSHDISLAYSVKPILSHIIFHHISYGFHRNPKVWAFIVGLGLIVEVFMVTNWNECLMDYISCLWYQVFMYNWMSEHNGHLCIFLSHLRGHTV